MRVLGLGEQKGEGIHSRDASGGKGKGELCVPPPQQHMHPSKSSKNSMQSYGALDCGRCLITLHKRACSTQLSPVLHHTYQWVSAYGSSSRDKSPFAQPLLETTHPQLQNISSTSQLFCHWNQSSLNLRHKVKRALNKGALGTFILSTDYRIASNNSHCYLREAKQLKWVSNQFEFQVKCPRYTVEPIHRKLLDVP